MNWPGFPAPVVTICTPSSRITWAMPAAQGFISRKIGPGSRILAVGFGGGLTWGGCLIEFA